ncbi:amidohydrolase family protein [Chitinophaga pendula]|uniref:amidohydrolase family protein n=1 Tax=Chitinophaga TaxID=79328 RepID=UPI000BAF201C|nr:MULTISPECIES: amidohydrolase family protein [Chitinophaga]ASZ11625.1 amidohydrolase [Chitinophaga sp. MD30]UCJ05364.1 amidohydrolase family protein [Chitinophaga pendula]
MNNDLFHHSDDRIDSHQHFWRYHPVKDAWITDDMQVIQRDFLPDDLQPVLTANGITGCVAVQADQSEAETDWLLQLAGAYPFIKGVVGWVDLRAEHIRERLLHYKQFPLLKGFRHIVQAEPDPAFLLGKEFLRGIAALQDFGFTYDILVLSTQLPAVVSFVAQCPAQKLVVDHLAKPAIRSGDIHEWANDMRQLGRHPHVYCKVSGMVTEADWQGWHADDLRPYLDVVFEAFGPERLLFGSDWPVCLVAAQYAEWCALLEDYMQGLTFAEKRMVWGGNAKQFYNL